MKFVQIEHPQFGTTTVAEARVPYLSEGWKVVDGAATPAERPAKPAKRTTRAPRARKSPARSVKRAQARTTRRES